MLDRASSFHDQETVDILTKRYVPVALDVFYEERRKDAAGELYWKIVKQRENLTPDRTTQGFYIATPDGRLLNGWNNRNGPRLKKRLKLALNGYGEKKTNVAATAKGDLRYERSLPHGAVVVDVRSRILKAAWEGEGSPWEKIRRQSIGRDHLWITNAEREELVAERWPASLTRRLARFHLIDNTRGEAPMWRIREVHEASLTLKGGLLTGRIRLSTDDNPNFHPDAAAERFYNTAVRGVVTIKDGALVRFDVVVRGTFFGEGRWTPGSPKKPFTLAVAFGLANPKLAASKVPPQAARDLRSYLEAR
ncbi:MAG: hypothetical protein HRU14_12740 [Planctomycetes bacterium]|nr:hypothetical protein [Planctomycetota bacterium]